MNGSKAEIALFRRLPQSPQLPLIGGGVVGIGFLELRARLRTATETGIGAVSDFATAADKVLIIVVKRRVVLS